MSKNPTENEIRASLDKIFAVRTEVSIIPMLVEAIYPLLIPIEQQDCAIQKRNYVQKIVLL